MSLPLLPGSCLDLDVGCQVLSACKHEPVATSATLAYVLCRPLHESVSETCDYLCAMGTLGDLGTSFQFPPPFPQKDMKACFKKYTKKAINDAISLINARELRSLAFEALIINLL